mmetsp:Transcript_42437/g.135995  ORF Transcript_42437/g.135995 Transcript_42437/m.135995 type:complete len:266 (+) Transcript_42437:1371-2168(+)
MPLAAGATVSPIQDIHLTSAAIATTPPMRAAGLLMGTKRSRRRRPWRRRASRSCLTSSPAPTSPSSWPCARPPQWSTPRNRRHLPLRCPPRRRRRHVQASRRPRRVITLPEVPLRSSCSRCSTTTPRGRSTSPCCRSLKASPRLKGTSPLKAASSAKTLFGTTPTQSVGNAGGGDTPEAYASRARDAIPTHKAESHSTPGQGRHSRACTTTNAVCVGGTAPATPSVRTRRTASFGRFQATRTYNLLRLFCLAGTARTKMAVCGQR